MHSQNLIMRYRLTLALAACYLALGLILPVQRGLAQAQQPRASQAAPFRFEHLRTSQGLSIDYLYRLMVDRRGFLWIGSLGGLERYDGYTFTVLVKPTRVFALAEDPEGMIWAGTDEGLSRIDPETDTVTHYRHNPGDTTSLSQGVVWALHVDRAGTLWVGTSSGLDRFDPATETFTHFQHLPEDPNSLSRGRVRSIYQDREGVLWIGTEGGGLNRSDPGTMTFTRYQHDPGDGYSLIDNSVFTITADRQGTLYVGTCQSGLHRYDRTLDRFERLVADTRNPAHLYAPKGILEANLACSSVLVIHEDTEGGSGLEHTAEGSTTSTPNGVA